MKAQQTARRPHVTERQKAWARVALLTTVGLVCPPLAAARSGVVWGMYLVLVVLYSLWTLRITRASDRAGNLGYLLCAADFAALVPILAWSLSPAMPIVLSLLWLLGGVVSWRAARFSRAAGARSVAEQEGARLDGSAEGAPLERALRVRLGVWQKEGTRFALVLLRLAGYDKMIAESGKTATKDFLRDAGRRGLRRLGPDAQLFPLPGGRMAFIFAVDSHRGHVVASEDSRASRLDTRDTESVALALASEVCDQTLDGRALECVAGWATAPADGASADDLMYAAESGAQSSAAFRRVNGPRISVAEPEKKRAAAG
jgi:hypothetical protein